MSFPYDHHDDTEDVFDEAFFLNWGGGVKLGTKRTPPFKFPNGEDVNVNPNPELEEMSCVPFICHWHAPLDEIRLKGIGKGKKAARRRRSFDDVLPSSDGSLSLKEDFAWDCGICLETACDPCVSTCGHLFCYSDLRRWLDRNPTNPRCPVCKAPCHPERDVVPIFGRGRVLKLTSGSMAEERKGLLRRRTSSGSRSRGKETDVDIDDRDRDREPTDGGTEGELEQQSDYTPTSSPSPTLPLRPSLRRTSPSPSRYSLPPLINQQTLTHLLGHAFTIAAFAIFLSVLLS